MTIHKSIYQFRIELLEIQPLIWRRLQVPAEYSFWDLHVAIQDAMGWLDYHLHEYRATRPNGRKIVKIGIPDEETDRSVLPGWEVLLSSFFTKPGLAAAYDYDFGDGWRHSVLLEGILLRDQSVKYPLCTAGERACPPEDCGGIAGYERLLDILSKPDSEEFKDKAAWLRGHAKNYFPYQPDQFDPAKVRFWNPSKRWDIAFGQDA